MTDAPNARAERLRRVAEARLGWVRCAVEHVHHRHNTSALLRTCDAMGVHRVHLVGDERFRASVGPARGADRWLDLRPHRTAVEAVEALRRDGVRLVVADLADDALPPEAVPLDRPVCLWFGAEVLGVDPWVRSVADAVVTVPMHGFAQSLNVSVAAGMVLHTVATRARALGAAARLGADEVEALVAAWAARDAG